MRSNPWAFAAAEAQAQGAAIGVVVWEAGGALHFRTIPDGSAAVLIGLHDLLGHAIDAMASAEAGDVDDDPDA